MTQSNLWRPFVTQNKYLLFRFVPTMKCNYRCAYCFVPGHEKTTNSSMFDEHTPEEWISAMKNWAKYEVEFYCWGGEPFLLDGTYEIVKGWTQYDHVISGSRIDTNISLANKIIERCPTSKVKLNCSWHTQYDSLDQLYKKIKPLSDLGMVGMVNFVASEYNMKILAEKYGMNLEELIKRFDNIGVFVNIAADFTLLDKIDAKTHENYKKMLLKYQCPEDWKQLRCEKSPCMCEANHHFFTVYPNGDIKPCLSNTTCGNFFQGTLDFPECTVCFEKCPSLVSYPFRADNDFPYKKHLVEYVNRNQKYRKTFGNLESNGSNPGCVSETSDVPVQNSRCNKAETKSRTSIKQKGSLVYPRLSIVLPTYNHLHYLPASIQSILTQTFTDFELIIVNDGSTDGTREYLDTLKDPRIKVIHQENKRLPEALNTGFRAARGELLTWISSDNYCVPIFLEALVAALDNYPDTGFAYSAFAWINEKDQITGVHRDQNYTYHSLLCCNPGTASFMYRRICQDQVGLYDPGLEGAEDWDMWLRITEQFSTVYVPEILYYYRLHNNSMTAKISEQVRKSAQETFVKALMRKNNHLNVADLYPSIAICKDQASAKFHAYFDMGTALLQSPWFDYQTHGEAACQFLEKALSILPTSFIAAGNLVVAYARSHQWEKAIHLLQQLQNINHPQVATISDKIRKASHQNDPELLLDMPLFTVDKSSLELFQLEHKQKRIFSFTDSVHRYYNNTDGTQASHSNSPDLIHFQAKLNSKNNNKTNNATTLLNKSVDEIPDLSISFCIITNGKRSDLVKLVIKSIHAQNIPHYEIIVVGRYHTEPEIVYLPAEAVADAGKLGLMRNIAVSKTKYNNITMLDDDIILSPDWYKAFKEYGNAFDILTSQIRLPDGGRYWDHVTYGGPRGHIILDEFENDDYIYMTGGGGWVMKKHVASSVAWDEKRAFYEGEDLDFARRCLAKGFKIAHNRTMLVYHADPTYTLVGRIILRRKQGQVQQGVESVASSLSASQIFEQAKTYESKDLFAEAADLLRIGALKYPDYIPFRNAWIDLENKFGGRLDGNLPWFCNGDPQYLSVLKRYQNE